MENKTNYYAVIPANVRYAKIKANAKLLYGEITALTNQQGYCWASNGYFAELYGVSEVSVSLWIKELIDNGFIESEITNNSARKLYVGGIKKSLRGYKENLKGVLTKVNTNTTSNNTNNIVTDVTTQSQAPVSEEPVYEPLPDFSYKPKKQYGDKRIAGIIEKRKELKWSSSFGGAIKDKFYAKHLLSLDEYAVIIEVMEQYEEHRNDSFMYSVSSLEEFYKKYIKIKAKVLPDDKDQSAKSKYKKYF